jgi:RND family efflux transporter MFP subunit
MHSLKRNRRAFVAFGAAAAFVLAGCSKGPAPAAPAPEVRVVTVEQRDVPVTQDWIGSLDGFVNAQIRAQVSGYLVKQDYKEGTAVRKGDVLFEIDPRPFAASLAQAEAMLAQAKAQLGKAEQDVARDTPLAKEKAISQEEMDDAVQSRLAALAQVQAAEASVDQSRLSLSFTRVISPVDGIAGLVTTQIGDLVGPTTGPLTTVSQVDPIKAYFSVSEQTYLALSRGAGGKGTISPDTEFSLVLSDGTVYPRKGKFFAIDNEVDANTGSLRAVALFPNPAGLLRPGQYARVRAVVEVAKAALVLPLRAMSELQGSYQVATVDASNHAHIVTVGTGPQVGGLMVITSGLAKGDRVVADGTQKIVDGGAVNPVAQEASSNGK